ncbi:unnamed protein product [Victoria cruziana]
MPASNISTGFSSLYSM